MGTSIHVESSTLLAVVVALSACGRQTYSPPEDAGKTCPVQAEYPCRPVSPGTGVCAADPKSSEPRIRRIPADAGYPADCVLVIPTAQPDDRGECIIDGTCRCAVDGGAGSWSCAP